MGIAHRDIALGLLPSGRAFPTHSESKWFKLLEGLTAELDRVFSDAASLLTELNPAKADRWLPEWEKLVGESSDGLDISTRRSRVIAKLRLVGRQDPAMFVELAAALGVEAAVEEFTPARCTSSCTAPLTQDLPSILACNGACNAPLQVHGWRFYWRLRQLTPAIEAAPANCLANCVSPLAMWGNPILEASVAPRVPAHTIIMYCYGEE